MIDVMSLYAMGSELDTPEEWRHQTSDPTKLDSARASAELFGRSFGRISASARIFMIQKKLKLLLEQKLRLITESLTENGANLGHEY